MGYENFESILQAKDEKALDSELSSALKSLMVEHKRNYVRLTDSRFKELLPILIGYKNAEETAIDFLRVEVLLRNDYDVVIGENRLGHIMLLGYVKAKQYDSDVTSFVKNRTFNYNDVVWLCQDRFKPKRENFTEITFGDDCKTGTFVILTNKVYNLNSDHNIIEFYTRQLAELMISRYSMSMQIRANTVITGDWGDENINQIISSIYNAQPFVKATKSFDFKDRIFLMENSNLASSFSEIKREQQNLFSEMCVNLGIPSIAVDKESGVNESESNSNNAITSYNDNIYTAPRVQAINKLNKRYGYNIQVMFNDKIIKQFLNSEQQFMDSQLEVGGGNDEDDIDTL